MTPAAGRAAASTSPTTSATEVKELTQRFREEEEQQKADSAERDECGKETPIDEYSETCAQPAAELMVARLAETTAIVNELKAKVGKGCREALEGGNQYIPLDVRKLSACSADVGKP